MNREQRLNLNAGDYAISHCESNKTYNGLDAHKMLCDAYIAGNKDKCNYEPISDDLYEASEQHSNSYGRDEIVENPYSSVQFAFESGAQWKEDKMAENAVETHFDTSLPQSIWKKLKDKGVEDGDRLLIIKV